MIAVDTNVLVRIVTNDDVEQAKRALLLLQREQFLIPKTVFLEMEWVLRHAYRLERAAIFQAFLGILGLPNVIIEDPTCVARAVGWYEDGLDFADALNLAASAGAEKFFTFDNRFYRKASAIKGVVVARI